MKKMGGYIVAVIISVALSLLLNNTLFNQQKTGWISLPGVFNKFEYKAELEKKFKMSEEARKKIVDSLELNVKILYKTIQATNSPSAELNAKFELQRDAFLEKKEQLEAENLNMRNDFNNQILTQLNQYVKDYGKENNYKIILGAEGNGSLMYGNEADDLTEEILVYINEKYKGKVK
ncbi:MAG: OmpH family outer membrane protein [Bacteroidota bacterium]|nr:OmpH family outer membrane protein [Bacteroidota bacterium]